MTLSSRPANMSFWGIVSVAWFFSLWRVCFPCKFLFLLKDGQLNMWKPWEYDSLPSHRVCCGFLIFFFCHRQCLCWESQILSEPDPFPVHAWWLSSLTPICSCLWMSSSLMSGSKKWKKKKIKRESNVGPLNPFDVTSVAVMWEM